jgi:hypothetical protein
MTEHETVATRFLFKPFAALSEAQQLSVLEYCTKYYKDQSQSLSLSELYWWKESTVGDNNWISYDCRPHIRIAAPHLRRK